MIPERTFSFFIHDFSNILAAMNNYAQCLADGAEGQNTQKELAENILAAGTQGQALIAQIMLLSRAEDQGLQEIDLVDLMRNLQILIRPLMGHDLEIIENIEVDKALVKGNAAQITRLLMNFCLNARDAMEGKSGRLELTLGSKDINGKNHICITVSDNGCGMSSEVMEKIFDPFFTTKPADKGSGLGLAEAQDIIKMHNGTLNVQSTVGEGTLFEVLLPALEPPA